LRSLELPENLTCAQEVKDFLTLRQGIANTGVYQDPWEFWRTYRRDYPTLARLAAKMLIIPATSVPIERLFSKLKHMVPDHRTSLKPERVQQLMIVKENLARFPHSLSAYHPHAKKKDHAKTDVQMSDPVAQPAQ
jgi:hypothetical protein